MKFFRKTILKKITLKGWIGLGVLVLALMLVPQVTHAGVLGWIFGAAGEVIGKALYIVAYFISLVAGVVVGFEAWLIEIILNLNTQIVNSPPVHFGFPVALSIANLGFTAAIIVIAIATILRWSGYGMKQILWKLVVAALLVNFSLVFAGAILNFADQLTLYFLNQVSPAGSGSSFSSFADSFAGAFNPQRSVVTPEDKANNLTPTDIQSVSGMGVAGEAGADIGKLFLPVISLAFTIFSLAATVITLAVFVFMLLYRYVALGILLIIMPFAWLMWIFPGLSSQWSKWWSQFLKQVFFAPLVVFFLYLAILTNQNMASGGSMDLTSFSGSSARSGISNFFGNLLSLPVQGLMNTIIIVGITLGGLYVANQLSIVGAKAAMGATKGFYKGAGKYAGAKTAGKLARFATQPRTTPLPTTGFKKIFNPLRRFGRGATRATARMLPTETYNSLERFGRDSARVTFGGAVFQGMKKGSGLFKGKQARDWECQNCHYIERSVKKPNICRNCRITPPNWAELTTT